jgi:hypothetical protein
MKRPISKYQGMSRITISILKPLEMPDTISQNFLSQTTLGGNGTKHCFKSKYMRKWILLSPRAKSVKEIFDPYKLNNSSKTMPKLAQMKHFYFIFNI